MSNILTSFADGIINYLLLDSVIAAVLTPLAWGLIKVAKIRAPIYRHMVWLYVLVGIVALPPIWLYGPRLTLAVLPAQAQPAEAVTRPMDSSSYGAGLAPEAPAEIHSPRPISTEAPAMAHTNPSRPFPVKAVLVGLWLVGIVFMLTRVTVGWYRLRRICLSAKPVSQSEYSGNMGDRQPKILLTSQVDSPVCFGLLQPVIILPREMYNNSTSEDLQMVLSHELAHIERRDCWTNLFQRLVEAVFFFNPLVWYASYQLTRQREQICDNYVLAHGASATNYAKLLSRIVEQGFEGTHFQAVALFEGRLLSRVRSLLDPKHSDQTKPSRGVTIAFAVATLLCFTFGTLRLEAKSEVDTSLKPTETGQMKTADANDAASIDPNAVKQDFESIAQQIVRYKRTRGFFPNTLKELKGPLPEDVYSPTGEDYHYEFNRKRFILSSCGQDGVYGNGDDEIFVGFNHRSKSRSGRRHEIYPLEEDEDINSQTEIVGPSGRRPTGNCSISGRVVSQATGEPVDYAKVYLFYQGTHDALFIDVAGDGSFEFKDIPAGKYSLAVIHTAGFQEASYNPHNKDGRFPPFTLNDGEKLSDIVFELKPAFRISGRILDEDGNLLEDTEGLHVLAWGQKEDDQGKVKYYNARQSNINRLDGSYSLNGLDGSPVYVMVIDWHANTKDNPYPPCYYPGTFSRNNARQITFDAQPDVENIDIRLQRAGGLVLQGAVTDETGQPVPKAFVVIHRRDMLFDFVTAYTDEKGHYEIKGLGEGEFLVHVDAVHQGLVRIRTPIDIDGTDRKTQLDFTLKKGVMISGKFVDEDGNDWQVVRSYGHARIEGRTRPTSSFSLTDFRNKYGPKDVRSGSAGSFYSGEGDYQWADMIFPIRSSFVLQGMMPGHTIITFSPKEKGRQVLKILHNGQNIMETGLQTKPGQEIKDVTIVIGTP